MRESNQVWYEHFLLRCRITNVQLAVKSMVKIIMSKGHYLRENCEITKFEDQLGMHFKNIKMPSLIRDVISIKIEIIFRLDKIMK